MAGETVVTISNEISEIVNLMQVEYLNAMRNRVFIRYNLRAKKSIAETGICYLAAVIAWELQEEQKYPGMLERLHTMRELFMRLEVNLPPLTAKPVEPQRAEPGPGDQPGDQPGQASGSGNVTAIK